MATSNDVTHHHAEEHPENHEHTDVHLRGIAITLAGLVAVIILVMILLYFLFGVLDYSASRVDVVERRTEIEGARPETRRQEAPRLQGIPGYHDNTAADDTRQMKLENERILNTSRVKADGFHQIPIEQAKKLLIERNMLPARAATAQESGQE